MQEIGVVMVTRESELERLLTELVAVLPEPMWAAIIDDDGLLIACIPHSPAVSSDTIAAMTVTGTIASKRITGEIEGGSFRFSAIAGSQRQLIVVALDKKRFLSLGFSPQVQTHQIFGPLSEKVPEILKTLKMHFSA
ncbi:MAG: roadblock/LC7 domain-containing protein [Anaerolineales bacterium]|jgi:predicted regulator of Ras-like GTPase activity (Roadblock/LC7/MglB family)